MEASLTGRDLQKWLHCLRAGFPCRHTLPGSGCLTLATHVLAGFLAPGLGAALCQFSVSRSKL